MRAEVVNESLNLEGRGIDVLIDLLNSQAKGVFPKKHGALICHLT